MLNRAYKFSAGIFCGCLVCFLFVGCGGKADPPEKQKQTQEIVRKIPVAEPQPQPAEVTEKKEQPRPGQVATVVAPVEKAVAPEAVQPQQAPAESEPVTVSAAQETTDPVVQPEAAPEPTVEAPSAEEKQAEIDAITREAGAIKGEGATVTEMPPEETAEADKEAPVIDLGLKEAPADEDATEDLGYAQMDEDSVTSELFNPFMPLFKKEKTGVALTEKSDTKKFRTELEKIDIGQLSLGGVIQAQSGNRAIVVDASGKGYVIKEGTYVGLNSGTVEKIESDKIVIVELLGTGQSKTVLKLQKPAGE